MFNAYKEFFTDSYMMSIFLRTIKISLISSLICMTIGVPVSYYISRVSKKLRGLFIALTVFPILTNSVVRSFAWMSILGKNGLINTLLTKLNIITAADNKGVTNVLSAAAFTYIAAFLATAFQILRYITIAKRND
jgi:ABC-type spermidine/putrescine transport system permease subunit I